MYYIFLCDLLWWDDGIRFSLEIEISGGLSLKVCVVVVYLYDIVFFNNRFDI